MKRKKFSLGDLGPIIFLALLGSALSQNGQAPSNCSVFSSSDADQYWDAVGKCPSCSIEAGCGFCLSTLQCLPGIDASGPTDGTSCPNWVKDSSSCPAVPNCGDYVDCSGCARQDECAWCASSNQCTTIAEAFSMDCRGLVFEPPCPDNYVSENIIVGNLVVRADPSFGGGSLNVSGAGIVDSAYAKFHLYLNPSQFDVLSSGAVSLVAGNSSSFNGKGGSLVLQAGDGISTQGGSGGDVILQAGSGSGEVQFGGNTGVGGNVTIEAGNSSEGAGGSLLLAAGDSFFGLLR